MLSSTADHLWVMLPQSLVSVQSVADIVTSCLYIIFHNLGSGTSRSPDAIKCPIDPIPASLWKCPDGWPVNIASVAHTSGWCGAVVRVLLVCRGNGDGGSGWDDGGY